MAAAVVYDGAGSGGTLFEGKKFFVAQRVPTRSRWVELITANGGEVVHLEKLADILIADHARKNAPAGSYSWKYIEKSVQNGKLENLDDHRAGPAANTVRPVGSGLPTRTTRTPFTPADDRLLIDWVRKAEARGLPTKGNAIFEQLERLDPRHTFQSWRDRWVKQLQQLPHPDLALDDPIPGPVHERNGIQTNKKPSIAGSRVSPVIPPSSRSAQKSHNRRLSPAPALSRKTTSSGQPFTEEDCDLLWDEYEDIMNIDETLFIDAWEAWAEKYPQHTAKEWLRFWTTNIKGKIKPEQPEPEREPKRRKIEKALVPVTSTHSQMSHRSRGSEVVMDDAAVYKQLSSQHKSPNRHKHVQPDDPAKRRFEDRLTQFAEEHDIEIDFRPIVSGRRIRLFELWLVVEQPRFGGFDAVEATQSWAHIATELAFEISDHDAPIQLRDIYDRMLADFAEMTSGYHAFLQATLDNGDELTKEQMDDLELLVPNGSKGHTEGEESVKQRGNKTNGDDLEIPSSPPQRHITSAGKRRPSSTNDVGNLGGSSKQVAGTPYKHQRVDKGKSRLLEIPSTPDDIPSLQPQAHDPSPLKDSSLENDNGLETEDSPDDEESMFVKHTKRKIFPKSTSVSLPLEGHAEPETQDFHFSVPVDIDNQKTLSQRPQEHASNDDASIAAIAGSSREDSSTQSQTDSQREEAEIFEFVDRHVALGYPEEIVRTALLATTMETGDAALVMEALMKGDGIPKNIQGVWTAEDDGAVQVADHAEYERVVAKHGEARCVKRRQLLKDLGET